MKILMVCLGNICRSPLAEGIMAEKVRAGRLNWTVDSAGTSGWHIGELPDPRSIAIAKKYGIDITYQRARKFEPSDLDDFDLIFAMDSTNFQHILDLASSEAQRQKVKLIMNEVKPSVNEEVPDPYWNDNGFEQVFQMLEGACDQIIRKYS